MSTHYRWGIMGAGIIARKMADALHATERAELLAVGSKSAERARQFAEEMNVPRAGTYDELLRDPEIDIVYVATTHNYHHANALLALEHGKHVVIEKPITVNAAEAQELIDTARVKGLFLMEALWARFVPSWVRMRKLIREGAIGEVRLIDVSFGKFAPPQFQKRLNDPALAGGATLDIGVYPISFCCYLAGEMPVESSSTARLTSAGVDEFAAYQLSFPSGATAQIATSFNLRMTNRATVYGTRGYIEFSDFPRGDAFTVAIHDGDNDALREERITLDQAENGFVYQVAEVTSCLDQGLLESSIMPAEESRDIMALMDRMRTSWGVVYENDR
ncbi:MAG: Gfo/Idh/MocA family oxidoreductase [Spirochaeta sp.]|jgi:dihydrodiol dehydrogenase / D-xylose 1-dehydrogenase (NADP)|nr:Gfo/Idh/MocA family oxidoreductase [Spirochaeta sp.]